ncbi:hypothetical protein PO909_005768, partial [Leuciscus waleckii]
RLTLHLQFPWQIFDHQVKHGSATEDQNNDILKHLSQILSKIQKRRGTIFSTKTTLPDRDVDGLRTPLKTVLRVREYQN